MPPPWLRTSHSTKKEDVDPQLIAGVTGAVCGVVSLLVA
jgi:hypothetical protein